MKKHILAAAVAAAVAVPAMAQNVSVTGIMDAMYLSGKHFGQSYSEIGQSGARTTNVQVVGSEDLGGGLKANFRFEVQPLLVAGDGNGYNNIITGASGASGALGTVTANGTSQSASTGQSSQQSGLVGKGYSFVGVSGGFGAVEFGTINSPSFRTFALASGPFQTGIGSSYGIAYGSTSSNTFTRFENSAMYQSPTMNGFQVQALVSLGNESQYGSTTGVFLRRQNVRDFAVAYEDGPFSARAALLTTETSPNEAAGTTATALASGSNVKLTTTTLAARYNFGVASVGGIMQAREDNGGLTGTGLTGKTETSAYGMYVTVPFGASMRAIASSSQRRTNLSSTDALEGQKTTLYGIGGEYDLSKRTFLYARYESGKRADVSGSTLATNGAYGAAGVPADSRVSRLGLGVSHQF